MERKARKRKMEGNYFYLVADDMIQAYHNDLLLAVAGFLLLPGPDKFWGPPSLLSKKYRGLLLPE
jgi:hypothetical protein